MWLKCWPLLFTVVAADLQEWLDNQLGGDDFDFQATYPSGLTLSTDDKKRGVLDYEKIVDISPEIQVKGLDEQARKKRYLAFEAVWYIPYSDGLDDVIMSLPWISTNLTVLSNGTLSYNSDSSTGGRSNPYEGGEVRNGTLQVWEFTQEMDDWLNHDEADGRPMPMWFNLARVWSNSTSRVSTDFSRSNIDFKFQNKDGDKRCDVSETGAPIPGKERGDDESCDKTPTPASEEEDEEEKEDSGKKENDEASKTSKTSEGDSNGSSETGTSSASETTSGDDNAENAGGMVTIDRQLASLILSCAAVSLVL